MTLVGPLSFEVGPPLSFVMSDGETVGLGDSVDWAGCRGRSVTGLVTGLILVVGSTSDVSSLAVDTIATSDVVVAVVVVDCYG